MEMLSLYQQLIPLCKLIIFVHYNYFTLLLTGVHDVELYTVPTSSCTPAIDNIPSIVDCM